MPRLDCSRKLKSIRGIPQFGGMLGPCADLHVALGAPGSSDTAPSSDSKVVKSSNTDIDKAEYVPRHAWGRRQQGARDCAVTRIVSSDPSCREISQGAAQQNYFLIRLS